MISHIQLIKTIWYACANSRRSMSPSHDPESESNPIFLLPQNYLLKKLCFNGWKIHKMHNSFSKQMLACVMNDKISTTSYWINAFDQWQQIDWKLLKPKTIVKKQQLRALVYSKCSNFIYYSTLLKYSPNNELPLVFWTYFKLRRSWV